MSRPRHPLVLGLAATAIALVPTGGVPTALAEDTNAGDCVRFEVARTEPDMAYTVDNSCTLAVNCTLSWRLVCGENREGKVIDGRRRFRVASSRVSEVTIDARVCGNNEWSVEDVAWVCGK
ncbi:MAG: hypothetical protein JW751_04310 [Polyangiaceae bacterium]|nr:hypothetical protein [Polyangiaceae bacterium]